VGRNRCRAIDIATMEDAATLLWQCILRCRGRRSRRVVGVGVISGHVWYVEVRAVARSGWDVEPRVGAVLDALDAIEDARKVGGRVFGIWHVAVVAIAIVEGVVVVFVVWGIIFSGIV
jgi:hypothetical protein